MAKDTKEPAMMTITVHYPDGDEDWDLYIQEYDGRRFLTMHQIAKITHMDPHKIYHTVNNRWMRFRDRHDILRLEGEPGKQILEEIGCGHLTKSRYHDSSRFSCYLVFGECFDSIVKQRRTDRGMKDPEAAMEALKDYFYPGKKADTETKKPEAVENKESLPALNQSAYQAYLWNGEQTITLECMAKQHHQTKLQMYQRCYRLRRNHILVEGQDFYHFKGEEGAEQIEAAGYGELIPTYKRGHRWSFSLYLYTNSGYMKVSKSLNDQKSWDNQQKVINALKSKKAKNQPVNEIDVPENVVAEAEKDAPIKVGDKDYTELAKRLTLPAILYMAATRLGKLDSYVEDQVNQAVAPYQQKIDALEEQLEQQKKGHEYVMQLCAKLRHDIDSEHIQVERNSASIRSIRSGENAAHGSNEIITIDAEEVPKQQKFYTLRDVAERLGLYTENRKPHLQCASAFAKMAGVYLDLDKPDDTLYCFTVEHQNHYKDGTPANLVSYNIRFYENGMERIEEFVKRNGENCIIESKSSNGIVCLRTDQRNWRVLEDRLNPKFFPVPEPQIVSA